MAKTADTSKDDKAASPFLADGDRKQGDTAAERTEHPDPAQPAAYADRENPVATEGTTEVPASGYQFADPNDPMRQRYVELERQKDEDIAKLVKMGDGRPKV